MATTVQHNTRGLLSLEATVKDNKWQKSNALNLKVIPLDGCTPQYKLPRDLSEGIQAQCLQAMCGFVDRTTKFTPVLPACRIIQPRCADGRCFYLICMQNEAVADQVRIQHYRAFADIKCYVGEDLTIEETTRRNKIKEIMCDYWQLPLIYNARF